MAFCKDCGGKLETDVKFCSNCGNPRSTSQTKDVTTIEQTSKKWKMMQLVSALITVFGVLSCVAASGDKDFTSTQTPMLMVFTGFICYIAARIGAWWNHG